MLGCSSYLCHKVQRYVVSIFATRWRDSDSQCLVHDKMYDTMFHNIFITFCLELSFSGTHYKLWTIVHGKEEDWAPSSDKPWLSIVFSPFGQCYTKRSLISWVVVIKKGWTGSWPCWSFFWYDTNLKKEKWLRPLGTFVRDKAHLKKSQSVGISGGSRTDIFIRPSPINALFLYPPSGKKEGPKQQHNL